MLNKLTWLSSAQALIDLSSPDQSAFRRLWLLSVFRLLISGAMALSLILYTPPIYREVAVASLPLLASAYFMSACACLWVLQIGDLAWRAQLYGQLLIDLALLSLIVHALGGVASGYALLLMFPLAAASTFLKWPFALFTAAVVSMSLMFDGLWRQSVLGQMVDWAVIGVHGTAGFILVCLLRFVTDRSEKNAYLAKSTIAQSALAQVLQEGILTVDQHHAPGVIVVDGESEILTLNSAGRMLGLQKKILLEPGLFLSAYPALSDWVLATRRASEVAMIWPSALGEPTEMLYIRATPLPDAPENTMLHLELGSARQAAAQAQNLAGMGRLTASIAHEIRNPLAAISQAGQLLLESTHLQTEDLGLAQIMLTHTRRIERIVADVLDWSKALRVQPSVIDLPSFLESVCDDFKSQTNSAHPLNFSLSCQLEPNERQACFDAEHLRQILTNLFSNATRFTSGDNGAIKVAVQTHTEGWLIAVLDNGLPVDPQVKAHLFEPFRTASPQGTGLGLFLSREYAKSNGAQLRLIESIDNPKPSVRLLPPPFTKAFILLLPWALSPSENP